jgi:hypothetical protein
MRSVRQFSMRQACSELGILNGLPDPNQCIFHTNIQFE